MTRSAADPSPASGTTLVLASGNAGKLREFRALLAPLPLRLEPQPEGLELEETGETFLANARLKATAVARASGCWALADDSGLEVTALNGEPGVHSARYAADDAGRIARLLQELQEATRRRVAAGLEEDRSARFVAALALADPQGRIRLEVEGHCPGEILRQPRGAGGFGYDPVFLVPPLGRSFAEMDKAEKARVGHRGRAFALLEPQLRQLFGAGQLSA